MTDPPVANEEQGQALRSRLAQAFIALLTLLALLVYVFALLLAVRSVRQPFLGAFVEPTLVVNTAGEDSWSGRAAGLDLPDHLVALDGQPLTRPWSLYDRLSDYEIGDRVTLTVEDQDGERRQVVVALETFPASAFISFFVVPYGIGLVYLIIGVVVFVLRRDRAAGRAFPLFCVAFALSTGTFLDLYTTHRLMHVWTVGLALVGGSLIDLALVFPRRSSLARNQPRLRWLIYLPSVLLGLWGLITISDLDAAWNYIIAWRFLFFYAALGAILWFLMLLRQRLRAESPIVQEQSRIILLGAFVGLLPMLSWSLAATLQIDLGFEPVILFPPLILLPLSIAYAILRYRLLDVDLIVSRSLSYTLLTLLVVGGYLLVVNVLGLLVGRTIEANRPALVAFFIVVVTLVFNPLRTFLQNSVDRLFFRTRINYRRELEAFSRELGRLHNQSTIFRALSARIEAAVHPTRLMFYLYDERAAQFVPFSETQGPGRGVYFAADGGLAELLIEQHQIVHLVPGQSVPRELEREASQLEAVGASLYIPLTQQGWMALGEKRSGDPYSGDDLGYLEALGDQTSLALERMQLISDLERRVNELDALHLISQAINFTVGLDALLELIYAQTSRVLDTTNFSISLYDEAKETLSYAFYVENDERYYPDDEWPLGVGLTSEIIRHGHPILTDDYMSECLRRGVTPGGKAERAWMGVPLNAGDRVIGVMRVASSAPEARYTHDQLKVFSAIADQAAAILDKTWLYEEMEERARQLATLNEVGSAINSSLDRQTVLDLVTEKAVEILDAEAGSLFLTDQDTQDLIFEVAVGPTASDLVGMRLPPSTGIVGATADTQEPIIVNDAQRDRRWFSGTDESAGFVTRAVLSVPLVHKGESIGVVQVLNKKDGSPFDEQDQQLITAFAAQVAVAIENARLFTQTDEALADRVAELSMFQQIDHALNATLDYDRVLELTLERAMRLTDAEVGLVATVDEESEGLLFVTSKGYPPEYERYRETPWPLDQGILGRVARTGEPVLLDDVEQDPDYVAVVPETRSELTVPLNRGDEVIGVINLESPKPGGFRGDELHFATRLAARAVVPLENAKLYEQVKRANEAKSQFVSVVAHELKIPMTSIKGYARLLELSDELMDETKRGFIKTITSNVDRMSKMVNDLLDISRIETGRLKLEMEAVSIASVVEETLDSLRSSIEEKDLELKLSVSEDLPPVWGDRTRLVQVLINLVSNAYKYTVEGSVHIQAQPVELPLSDDGRTGRFVRCAVQDTGIGISEEDQERLFKSQFVRFENAAGVASGHGLGLWLVNRLVEMQGGQITFESKLGEGSTFAFTVPVADGRGTRDG